MPKAERVTGFQRAARSLIRSTKYAGWLELQRQEGFGRLRNWFLSQAMRATENLEQGSFRFMVAPLVPGGYVPKLPTDA